MTETTNRITAAQALSAGGFLVTLDGRKCSVPDDMLNSERRLLAEWVSAGGVIEPQTPVNLEPSGRLYKSTFVRRMSLNEAELFEVGLASINAWMRMLYHSVEYFDLSDALTQGFNVELAAVFGQARADELLGPPTVQEAAALTPESA